MSKGNEKKTINKEERAYFNAAHRLGRIATILVVACMIGIPIFVAKKYDLPLSFGSVMKSATPLLAIFVPVVIAEFFSYMPILGSASYLTYLTGNVLNLKIPCVLNAQALNNAEAGTEKADVISLLAVASSSLATMIIIIIGVILMVPLTPVLESPTVQTASKYILPALFGAMILPIFGNSNVGNYKATHKNVPIIVAIVVMTIFNYAVKPVGGDTGYWIIITIVISIILARIFYKKGYIKLIPLKQAAETPEVEAPKEEESK